MKKSTYAIIAVAVLLVIGASLWAMWAGGIDPEVAKAQRLRAQLTGAETEGMTDQQRREAWGQLREQMRRLSPEQRQRLWGESGGGFRQRMQQQVDDFFDLPSEQRAAHLDKQIDTMEARRAQFAQRGGRQGGPGGRRFQGELRGGRTYRSADERNQLHKRRLDGTTPENRAKWSEYRRQLEDRRRQRGLPPIGRPGPRP